MNEEVTSQFVAYRMIGERPRPPSGYISMEHMVAVTPLMWGMALITIGPGGKDYDGGYDDCWEYQKLDDALLAFARWDGAPGTEPEGWYRHPASGRRRPGGDPAKEYVMK